MLNARLIDELERSQRELEARAETERSLRDISARITSLGDPGRDPRAASSRSRGGSSAPTAPT